MKRNLIWIAAALAVMLLLPAATRAQDEHAFVGQKNCKKCHIKQYKSWEATKMSQAFESLKPGVDVEVKEQLGLDPNMDYTQDAECVTCHVTGYGKTGGFVSEAETPELVGVGCESCHGAGGTYTQDHLMSLKNKEYKRSEVVAAGMVETVSEAQCVICHNENVPIPDYTFNFEEKKAEGTHENFPLKYNHDG